MKDSVFLQLMIVLLIFFVGMVLGVAWIFNEAINWPLRGLRKMAARNGTNISTIRCG